MLPSVLLIALVLCLSASHAASQLALNSYFSTHMVLQRAPQQAVMWGTGDAGATVTVQVGSDNVGSAIVSADGKWLVQLPPREASLDHTVIVTDGNTTLTLYGVAFGDVYLCSGQSNMQITLNYSFGAAEAISDSLFYPNIRLFNVPVQQSNWTIDDASVTWQPDSWVLPSNSTLQNVSNPWDRSSYFSATCYWTAMYLYDSLNDSTPIGLVQASAGGTQVAAWTSNDTNLACGPLPVPYGTDNAPRNWPSVEYNAMIHPLLPMRFRAVLWYQGETDWWDADRYACSFPNLINDWRAKFKYDVQLPFYFVLVHPYTGANPVSRQSQQAALALPNVGVANAIDLGDRYGIAGDIHPRNKSFVGERLARWLRRDIYGQQVEVNGPQLLSVTAVNANATLTLTLVYSANSQSEGLFALATPDCNASLTDARGCCTEQTPGSFDRLITYSYQSGNAVYTGSSAATIDADARTITIIDTSANAARAGSLVLVSYAYADWPGCALYNADRLPALPFRVNVTVTGGDAPQAVLRLNNYFSNNMVLQRAPQQAVIWGYGQPGQVVTVQLDNSNVALVTIPDSGAWRAKLPPQSESLFHDITVFDSVTTVTLSGVLFGDVYLCSGQSNMVLNMNYSFGGAAAIAAAANYSYIRLFSIFPSYSDTPLNESSQVSYAPDSWVLPSNTTLQPPDPGNVGEYFSAVCYWTGMHIYDSLGGDVPIGLVQGSYGGTITDAWTTPDFLDYCGPRVDPPGPPNPVNNASVLYNALIHPLLPMRFTAVLWYQGEGDWFDIDRYACAFPNMISDWREQFGYPQLPWYFVLLAPWLNADPALRAAQLAAWPSPNVGVASAIDLGDRVGPPGDIHIHPRNKSYVGERLARWVRRDIYGQQVQVEGPHLQSITARTINSALTLTLQYSADSRSQGLFALATPDCNATALDADRCCTEKTPGSFDTLITYSWSLSDGDTYTGSSPAVLDATARTITVTDTSANVPAAGSWVLASYAYADWPGCALYNADRLPALPFQRNLTVNYVAPLTLNNLFSSNMVLQRAPQQAVMWGTGEPGSTVTVSVSGGAAVSALVSEVGNWSVTLPATEASPANTIVVSDSTNKLQLDNVAFGDVYLCSGQSNMQVTLNYSFGGPDAMAAAASYPNLRLFNIQAMYSNSTLSEASISYAGGWVLPSASTLQNPAYWQDTWSYFSATCYWTALHLYDSLNGSVPLGFVQASFGGTCVAAWTSPDTNTVCGPIVTPSGGDNQLYNRPSVLYNAMIHPLLPLRLRGVLWYQGETDWWDADRYACSFPNMIQDWRTKFNASALPFYFVELAPYAGASVAVRQSQQAALTLPNVGVANAIDLGDRDAPAGNVHPRNKSFVGERLARWLQHDVYGQQVQTKGPQLLGVTAELTNATTVQVTLQYAEDGSSDGMFALPTPGCDNSAEDATGCCIQAGPSQYAGLIYYTYTTNGVTYTEDSAVYIDTAARTITTTQQPPIMPAQGQPMLVSYAYVDWPGCALYNADRLPALPFQISTVVSGGSIPAKLRLNNYFSNNMVLQRAPQQAAMWGTGPQGRTVTVGVGSQSVATTVVDSSGDWSVQLPAMNASLANVVTVSDTYSTLTLSNVAFGDVYLCSGQSNMQIYLKYSFGGADAIANASSYPNIRLFNVPPQNDTVAREETGVSYSPDSWVLPSASTLQNPAALNDPMQYFSAICYWTGVHISDSLNGSMAVGLVQSSVQGTMATAWTSPDTNTKCGPIIPAPPNTMEASPSDDPSVLYNAMIHPLLSMRFAAVLWYQGESDRFDLDRYRCSFPNLIADWRDKFGYSDAELPFYFVLLAPFDGLDPQLRLAQLTAWTGSNNVGVASAIDLGDRGAPQVIHPRNKSFVGERLARWVRRDIYGQQAFPLGPEPITEANDILVTADGTKVTMVLSYHVTEVNSGLYMLPTPDCTTCCHGGAGALLVTINDPGNSNASATPYRPPITIDQQAYTVTATFNLSAPVSEQATAVVGLAAEAWPQCVLYNRYNVPALPFITTVPINGGNGSNDDDGSSSSWVWAAAAAGVLLLVGVVIWLVVHYGRKRRAASADAEAGGYRDMDEPRSLLSDEDSSASS